MNGSDGTDDELRDFFKVKVNYAIVINGDLEAIEQLKRFLVDEGFRVIYQRKSLGKLIVKEENDG
ncbi:MAG: hypothetical protein IMZ58_10660 [Thermoplasmata archaeon]|nr:hypothetical protein [Thermoplasmata archaeon]